MKIERLSGLVLSLEEPWNKVTATWRTDHTRADFTIKRVLLLSLIHI